MVLVGSFICLCVLDGVAYTFGVFLDPLLVEMGGGRGQISSAGQIFLAGQISSAGKIFSAGQISSAGQIFSAGQISSAV